MSCGRLWRVAGCQQARRMGGSHVPAVASKRVQAQAWLSVMHAAATPCPTMCQPTHLDEREAAGAQAGVWDALTKVDQPAAGAAPRHGRPQPRVAGQAAQHRQHDCVVWERRTGGCEACNKAGMQPIRMPNYTPAASPWHWPGVLVRRSSSSRRDTICSRCALGTLSAPCAPQHGCMGSYVTHIVRAWPTGPCARSECRQRSRTGQTMHNQASSATQQAERTRAPASTPFNHGAHTKNTQHPLACHYTSTHHRQLTRTTAVRLPSVY